MASCVDDCLYYKVCSDFRGNICERDLYRFMEYRMTSDGLCEHFKNKADVVEVEKVAKILVDVTGIAPCEMVSANEWDYDYCNCAELCSQLNYKQCWERYLKHSKG